MSLSTAFNVISSSFVANAAQTAVVSNNIANVNTPGYSREIANVVTNSYGGADVASITREANAALLEQVSSSTSQAATQQAISDGLTTLAQTVDDSSSASSTSGAGQNGASPSAMLANLQSALTTYADQPTSSSAADAVVSAASDLAASLNSASAAVQRVRETADQNMTSSVNTINSLLNQFAAANNTVVTGLQTGANVSSAEDTRDSIVTQLAQQIGVSTTTAANGSESIYTDSGVTLFQDTPRAVSFTPTPTLVDGANGAPVTVDGVPITGANSPMPIQLARSPVTRPYGIRLRPNIKRSSTKSPAASSTPSPKAINRRTPPCPLCRACSPRRERPVCPRRRLRPVSPPRSRSTRMSTRRRAAIRISYGTAASPTPETRPIPTTRPARPAIRDASRSSSARSARPKASTRPQASAHRPASSITPTPP
jgi:flagellar basal body rod protein FlgB